MEKIAPKRIAKINKLATEIKIGLAENTQPITPEEKLQITTSLDNIEALLLEAKSKLT